MKFGMQSENGKIQWAREHLIARMFHNQVSRASTELVSVFFECLNLPAKFPTERQEVTSLITFVNVTGSQSLLISMCNLMQKAPTIASSDATSQSSMQTRICRSPELYQARFRRMLLFARSSFSICDHCCTSDILRIYLAISVCTFSGSCCHVFEHNWSRWLLVNFH